MIFNRKLCLPPNSYVFSFIWFLSTEKTYNCLEILKDARCYAAEEMLPFEVETILITDTRFLLIWKQIDVFCWLHPLQQHPNILQANIFKMTKNGIWDNHTNEVRIDYNKKGWRVEIHINSPFRIQIPMWSSLPFILLEINETNSNWTLRPI